MINNRLVISIYVSYFIICGTISCEATSGTVTAQGSEGCELEPSISGNKKMQTQILDRLRNLSLFGKTFTCEDKRHEYVYNFKICGDVSSLKQNVAVTRQSYSEGKLFAIGMRNVTSVIGNGEWTMLQHNGGDYGADLSICKSTSSSSIIMLLCDERFTNGVLNLLYEDEDYCKFVFELRIASLCNGAAVISDFSIFFISMLVLIVLYFMLGFLYLRFMIGAKGVDQIPHRLFWIKVGNRLTNCCAIVCRCEQYCGNSDDVHSPYSSGYSPIGEGISGTSYNIPQPNDRDSALLNP